MVNTVFLVEGDTRGGQLDVNVGFNHIGMALSPGSAVLGCGNSGLSV